MKKPVILISIFLAAAALIWGGLLAILMATTMFLIPEMDTHSWATSPPSPRFSRRCSRR